MVIGGTPAFRGRSDERSALDGMLGRLREGESAVLVMRGEAGIGKTELMHYCARQASGCRVARIAGVESELEMPFAALHQLCGPMLGQLAALPEPQQRALRVAFGLAAGNTPDRFVVGLAVLGLLAEVASERPLLCLVDDTQWLDQPTREVLGFVGRRLQAEAVMLLLAVRLADNEDPLPSLPSLMIEGLAIEDARALLTAAVPGPLDEQVRDRIVAEAAGNPLRLLAISRDMSPGELASGFGVPRSSASTTSMEEHYTLRLRALPEPTQQLLLLAAADPTGDASLLWRAAEGLGLPRTAARAAESEELLEIGAQVRFRHPLVRSAAYADATREDRAAAHLALAAATDATTEPERRVWHLATAASEPDESVASALEHSAATAQARAGLAAAAALLQRSVEMTADPERRAERALAAAQAHLQAGAFDHALALLAEVHGIAATNLQRARAERIRGQVSWASNPGPDTSLLLLDAAKRLDPIDPELARETYLEAWMASFMAGPLARSGGQLSEISLAAQSATKGAEMTRASDLCLDGLVTLVLESRAAAARSLRRAINAFLSDRSDAEWLSWGHLATSAAAMIWDYQSWDVLSAHHVELARASGALTTLSIALTARAMFATWSGDFDAATAYTAEEQTIKELFGISLFSVSALMLAAYRGRANAFHRSSSGAPDSTGSGEGIALQTANWTRAIYHNGLSQYAEALVPAQDAADETAMDLPSLTGWGLVELVEAAARSGKLDMARDAARRLPAHTVEDSDWAMGVVARCDALVAEDDAAEHSYAEAVARLQRTPIKTELARAHLVYGEWLRRCGRRVDARRQLRAAYDLFTEMGAEGFAERTRRELLATGEKVRKRSPDSETRDALTPQEEHVARLARAGRSNAEIGAELFLSVRTVEWHLRKIFIKLGVTSRKELKDALLGRSLRP